MQTTKRARSPRATEVKVHRDYQQVDGELRAMSRYAVTVEYREMGLANTTEAHVKASLVDRFGPENYSLDIIGSDEEKRTIDFDLLVDAGKLVQTAYVASEKEYWRNACEASVRNSFEDHTQDSIPFFGRPIDWRPVTVEYKGTAVYRRVEKPAPKTVK